MRFLISRAFIGYNNDQVIGLAKWADTERFDITALAPGVASQGGPMLDAEIFEPMIRALLVDRFKLAYHAEERPLTAYSLAAAKPKLKKADPTSRISCKNGNAPPGAPPGSRTLTCQNISMAQFAERLQNLGPGLTSPVLDATGLEGGWDFSLTFNMLPALANLPRPPDGAAPAGDAAASDPSGGYTIFEAIEKQLGLKLEQQKRPQPVIVIDHLEEKPTEN
jgi:uncharacterized protein (TIGR03435 family)